MQNKQTTNVLPPQDLGKSPGLGESKEGKLPNLIIIGAQKCGTSSLHYYLNLHPQISMSQKKELDFFIDERNWRKGIEWYKTHFTEETPIHGESSPNYTAYPIWKGVPERMYFTVPEARLIYIVRDPIDRIISGSLHSYLKGREDRKIEDVLVNLNNTLIFRSKYFMQIKQYLKYYSKSSILILTLEELNNAPHKTLTKVFKFLNVDESFYSPDFRIVLNKSSNLFRNKNLNAILMWLSATNLARQIPLAPRMRMRNFLSKMQPGKPQRPVLDEKLQKKLIDYLRDDLNHLREFTGNDFESWRA